jgi:SAM-dependent methyltransferase
LASNPRRPWERLAAGFLARMAKRSFNRGNHAEAIAWLRPLTDIDPLSRSAYGLAARAYAEQGMFDELDALIEKVASTVQNEKLQSIASALAEARRSDWQTQSAIRLIQYSPQTRDAGAGHELPVPYHSNNVGKIDLPGFRDPLARLRAIPVDFEGRSVMDIGCSLGGFLFPLRETIRWGVGIDNNPRFINVCQKLRSLRSAWNLDFYVHDIEKQPLPLLQHFLPEPTVDIVLILRIMSRGSLSDVLRYMSEISRTIIFEPIASHPSREADIETLRSLFASVDVVETDIFEPLDGCRHTLYCATNPIASSHGAVR